MKAGINGNLNMSILDGWFDEAADESGGWVIGDRDPYSVDRDDAHAAAIYSMLENEIVPMFYEGREQGVPVEWMKRVKQSLKSVSANFNCQRMVMEYSTQLYEPAHLVYERVCRDRFASSREHVRWHRGVTEKWPNVKFVDFGIGGDSVSAGSSVPMRAGVDLAALRPGCPRGGGGGTGRRPWRIGGYAGTNAGTRRAPGRPTRNGLLMFGRDFAPFTTGRLGYALRVSPNHCDDPLNRPCNALLKWAGEP